MFEGQEETSWALIDTSIERRAGVLAVGSSTETSRVNESAATSRITAMRSRAIGSTSPKLRARV